ncbi:MAG: hypothetical protein ACT4N8_02185, partial [Sphingosinicella sp.]|uniref:hypothetical protein n=1 Tax=Sphingosinicella sp. TaxID=1917971 RepID=UPI00403797F5
MKPARSVICWLALLLAPAGAAGAQPEIGSLINRDRGAVRYLENPDLANSAEVMLAFARCFARQQERAAESVVRLPYQGQEQATAVRRLIDREESCLGDNSVQLRFPPQLLVGGMAEHFILRRYEGVDISALVAMDDEAIARAGLLGRNAYEALSLCVVRRDPAAARALVGSLPRSSADRAVIDRIVPTLAPCIPAEFQLTFRPGALRALM